MFYKKKYSVLSALISLVLAFSGCASSNSNVNSSTKKTETANVSTTNKTVSSNDQLKIHFINVGQADSILLQQGNTSMLIDAGNNPDGQTVKNYIASQGITKLDYVIGTHPHEDHIGGMDYVINNLQVGKIYMPKVTANTKTFKDVLTAIKNKGLTITTPVPGDNFKLGSADCTILGPITSNPEDLNTYSIVIKVTFGNNKFLFTGDAQTSNEQSMTSEGYDLSADVLKVGHHGSHTSTSEAFLKQVNPKYAVISCGKGNDYGHPHKEVMERLQAKNIPVYRTDECGTIVCTSDGKNISFNVKPGDYKYGSSKDTSQSTGSNAATANTNSSAVNNTPAQAPAKATVPTPSASQNKSVTVYVTKTGKKYHTSGCRYLSKSKIPISLKDAEAEGYGACSVCNPPQ